MKARFILLVCAILCVLSSQQPALGQIIAQGPDPCKDHDIEAGGSMDTDGSNGDDDHFSLNIDMKGAGELLDDVADFICKLFGCGGNDDGGSDAPGGDETPGGDESPGGEENPGGDTPDGENPGGDTGDDAEESSGVCTTGGYSFDKLLNSFTVTQSRYKDGAFHIQLASGTPGRLLHVTVNQAFSLPRPVKRAAGLRGTWYVKPGTYQVQQNRLRIPVEKR